jgi:hypothetical protein
MPLWRRMDVLAVGVFLLCKSGVNARAPRLQKPDTEFRQPHGHRRSINPPDRTPLGAALRLSSQPGDRVGLGVIARQHSRRQLQRHVHRIGRSAVGRGWLHGKPSIGHASKGRLLCETGRTGTWNGRFGLGSRRAAGNLPAVDLPAFSDAYLKLTLYSLA